MKEMRLALLRSKVKTDLEKSHQNDPNCNVNGSKDENGREIEEENVSAENDSEEDHERTSDSPTAENEEEEKEEDKDDADDDEDDADDDEGDDDSGNDDDDNNEGNPNYHSESPILVVDEALPERTSSQHSSSKSDDKREASLRPEISIASGLHEASPRIGIPPAEEISTTPLEDLSRAIVSHINHGRITYQERRCYNT
ncbi:PREDICTED: glutamic acid-rich protein-like [Ipomoea nil]|uniref:glutamic acid-rich protein-like n=1 Tax=Ipomoea nil TaxID=35883 RepID=UPI000900DC74|nr:PREDICTED: glutamic acid-rich protein-like [Ipomoea nil]